jgi:DNA-binding GntR family transcriptional regulator
MKAARSMDRLHGLATATLHKPQTVADHIAAMLREAIAKGTLAPGTALRQDELAARCGFSRMPIRDALRLLEAEGLVSIHPTRGAFVAAMDASEIREIYAVRELLEIEALRLALPNLTAETLDEAAGFLGQIDNEPDVARWGALNRGFHLALYSACGNGRLLALIEAQHNAADRYVRILLSSLDYQSRSQSDHRELLAACRKRHEAQSLEWLTQHLREGSRALVEAIAGTKET